MRVVEVEGATGWYDTSYENKRDACIDALRGGLDLFLIHIEASDEAGHAGNLEEKVTALEHWDRRILTDLVSGLDAMGPWRMLLLPRGHRLRAGSAINQSPGARAQPPAPSLIAKPGAARCC